MGSAGQISLSQHTAPKLLPNILAPDATAHPQTSCEIMCPREPTVHNIGHNILHFLMLGLIGVFLYIVCYASVYL